MLVTKKIQVKVTKRTIDHYISKGYVTSPGEILEIDVGDLNRGSHVEICVSCDICGREIKKKYKAYVKQRENIEMDVCSLCSHEKTRISNLNKYGVENVMHVEEFKSNLTNTNLEKYGVINASKLQSTKDKAKNTCIERYGVENCMHSDVFKEKLRETCLKRYGETSYTKTQEYKEKAKATCLERYGTEYPTQNKDVKQNIVSGFLNKYGYDNVFKSEYFKQKNKDTCVIKYGVEAYSQSDDFRRKFAETWSKKSEDEIEEITKKRKATCLEKYGVESVLQLESTRKAMWDYWRKSGSIPTSSQQVYIFNALSERYGVDSVELNYTNGKYSYDVAVLVDSIKIDVEYDGWYWHDENKDKVRDEYTIEDGWSVLRIKGGKLLPKKENLYELVDEIINFGATYKEIVLDDWKGAKG